MSVLVGEKVDDGKNGANSNGDDDIEHELMEWHATSGLLAITTYRANVGSEINFFTHQANKSNYLPIRKSNARVMYLCWHPIIDIIATSWDSGDVIIRFIQNDKDFSLPNENTSNDVIKCMLWGVIELKICIVKKNGSIVLWKIINDNKGGMSKIIVSGTINEEANCICRMISESKSLENNDVKQINAEHSDELKKSEQNKKIESNECFIIGGANGGIYIFHQNGEIREIHRVLESAVIQLFFIERKNLLLALSEELFLHQLTLIDNHKIEEKIRIKMSGKWPNFQMIMIRNDMLAMCNGENEIRIWDLKNDMNGTVSLRTAKSFSATDTITCLSYSNIKDCLSAGTVDGKIANWKHCRIDEEKFDKQWILQEAVYIGSKVKMINWSTISGILAVSTGFAVTLLKEQPILSYMNKNRAVIQSGSKKLTLICLQSIEQYDIQVSITPKGVHIDEKHLAIWDDQQIYLYEIINESNSKLNVQLASNFNCSVSSVVVYQKNVCCIEDDKIRIRTFQGTVKQVISLPEIEGNPIMIDINNNWICIASTNGFIRIYDLSVREARQQYHSKDISKTVQDFKYFLHIKLNKMGNRVSFTYCIDDSKNVYPGIMVWDADSDVISNFNFLTGMTDQQQYEANANASSLAASKRPNTAVARKIQQEQIRYRLPDYLPGFHCWDSNDSRYLICEANHRKPNTGPNYLLSIFVTSEDGLHMQDLQLKSRNSEILLGCTVPYIYFIRSAMMNFSYYMTVDKMDEAFKAIKFIKSENAWEHMAHMCVKTQRLDIALLCLGNMGHASGARALKKSMKNGDPIEVQVAILAIQLGLLDEAQALFTSCGRYDLVNRLLQTRNRWDEAFKIAEKYDRIHLRNTYYNYANYLESINSTDAAIENYEKSGTHCFEVPRMLFDRPKMLEAYVKKTKHSGVQKWWAQYMESKGDVKSAYLYYQYAKDYLSVVRLLCRDNNIDEAIEIANSSGDKAACYHLGQYFEAHNDPNMAVMFFTKAHACSNALRLAKENNMTDKIANLALMAGGNELVEAAQYYENIPGQTDKAVMLYHKAGMINRALDLAFRTDQFSALDLITNELDENSDPRILERAAEFFKNNQQYNKAVQLLAYSKKYFEAIDLCKQKNVPMNEELAEVLTPSKGEITDESNRKKLLELIAECCVQQQNYHFAAKKYTQAGNKLDAMRSLVKSGDTARIVFFANAARKKEIYILAANYLQTLNWKEDCDLMKQIELFYNKANAYEHLASFYEACAQVEIDDYRDYNKAADALNEALQCIAKALQNNPKNQEYLMEKQTELYQTIGNIKEFIQIRTIYELDPIDAIRQLEAFADDKQVCKNIRLGDIYAVMIAYNVHKENYKKAYSLVQQLKDREPSIELNRYINKEIQDIICEKLKLSSFITDNKNLSECDNDQQSTNDEEVDYSYAMKRNFQ
uniref:Anaphase-promoting complex subunit 4 WD40 domain-containing protein n=1 Tax=Brugia malayi TaxID=6279 RepID=A0A7I4KED3_BRUMA